MKRRRKIALITMEFGENYQQHVLNGIFSRCRSYDYDVAVFSTLVEPTRFFEENLNGEMNIFKLINFDLFDGVVVAALPLLNDANEDRQRELEQMFAEKCKCKAVAVDLGFAGYETFYTNDYQAFYEIAEHIYEKHGCRKVYFLSAQRENEVSKNRENGFIQYTLDHNIPFSKDDIIYGDYWYGSGEKLADDIVAGRVAMPDAVVCGNDYMAIGLTNRLIDHGIEVPEQIAVTGFDGSLEASCNNVVITSYEPQISKTAAEAVDRLHELLDPDEPPAVDTDDHCTEYGLRVGDSCGCDVDLVYWKRRMTRSSLHRKKNWNDPENDYGDDVTSLFDTYMSEKLMSAATCDECMDHIYDKAELVAPYDELWLCLREDWLDLSKVWTEGYPDHMKIVMHSIYGVQEKGAPGFVKGEAARVIPTAKLFPNEPDEADQASVYYFLPIHATDEMYGYAVVRTGLRKHHRNGYLLCNWIRIVSNALSMIRVKNRLLEYSMKDAGTNLYNRRGLAEWYKKQPKTEQGILFVIMADMDGLKYINDHFGHADGDFALSIVADAVRETAVEREIPVRAGGDEFLLVGIGDYTEQQVQQKVRQIQERIRDKSHQAQKGYEVDASIGYCISGAVADLEEMIEKADVEMYCNKRRKGSRREK